MIFNGRRPDPLYSTPVSGSRDCPRRGNKRELLLLLSVGKVQLGCNAATGVERLGMLMWDDFWIFWGSEGRERVID